MEQGQLYQYLLHTLRTILPEAHEAQSHARLLVEEALEIKLHELFLHPHKRVALQAKLRCELWMARLKLGMPLQYAMGVAYFYNRPFVVTRHVLIPRRETEELVAWAHDTLHKTAFVAPHTVWRIADLGCGSGCIAITLAKQLGSEARLYGVDYSVPALRMAQQNALLHKVNHQCHWEHCNLLTCDTLPPTMQSLHMVVSNPPYIPANERPTLAPHVAEWEPENALFVPSYTPLLFYERIASLAWDALCSGGILLFECHAYYAAQVAALLTQRGYIQCILRHDAQGLPRLVMAHKQ